eukprot:3779315-Rhodomonas_salina.1
MSGMDIACAYAMSGPDMHYAAMSGIGIAFATRCPAARGAVSCRLLLRRSPSPYALSGTDLAHGAISLRAVRYSPSAWCYLPTRWSGTDLAHGAIPLRAPYALSGTDL